MNIKVSILIILIITFINCGGFNDVDGKCRKRAKNYFKAIISLNKTMLLEQFVPCEGCLDINHIHCLYNRTTAGPIIENGKHKCDPPVITNSFSYLNAVFSYLFGTAKQQVILETHDIIGETDKTDIQRAIYFTPLKDNRIIRVINGVSAAVRNELTYGRSISAEKTDYSFKCMEFNNQTLIYFIRAKDREVSMNEPKLLDEVYGSTDPVEIGKLVKKFWKKELKERLFIDDIP